VHKFTIWCLFLAASSTITVQLVLRGGEIDGRVPFLFYWVKREERGGRK